MSSRLVDKSAQWANPRPLHICLSFSEEQILSNILTFFAKLRLTDWNKINKKKDNSDTESKLNIFKECLDFVAVFLIQSFCLHFICLPGLCGGLSSKNCHC